MEKTKQKTEEVKWKQGEREKRSRKKGWLIALFAFVLIVGIGVTVVIQTLNKINRVDPKDIVPINRDEEFFEPDTDAPDTMNADEISSEGVTIVSSPYVKNILLIGQDRRPGEGRARSDSMIIVSLNTKTGVISLVSLMRDMYVPIPEYSSNRINAAYAFGGMNLLDETIKQDFGIVIDGNIEVDFERFIQVIGLIAPLDIDLKSYEVDYMNSGTDWNLQEGVNSLNAEQLLRYSRIRMVGNSDYERTDRQRRVVGTAINKLKTMPLSDIYSLVDQAMPSLTTDMNNTQILQLATTMLSNKPVIGGNYRLPFGDTYTSEVIRGMMVLVPDLRENSEKVQNYLYGDLMRESKK